MFHTYYSKWNKKETFEDIKIVQHTKVLGYMLDQKLNNNKNMEYVKSKLEKVEKLIRISSL